MLTSQSVSQGAFTLSTAVEQDSTKKHKACVTVGILQYCRSQVSLCTSFMLIVQLWKVHHVHHPLISRDYPDKITADFILMITPDKHK